MSSKKIKLPEESQKKCHAIIHSAAAAAAAAAVVPIPLADAIPITAIQVGMIIGLGKVFNIDINDSVAKAIAGCAVAQNVGKAVAGGLLKIIPGLNLLALFINPTVASAITETMGWLVADDFYKISINERPDNIISTIPNFENLFNMKDNNKVSNKTKKINVKNKNS